MVRSSSSERITYRRQLHKINEANKAGDEIEQRDDPIRDATGGTASRTHNRTLSVDDDIDDDTSTAILNELKDRIISLVDRVDDVKIKRGTAQKKFAKQIHNVGREMCVAWNTARPQFRNTVDSMRTHEVSANLFI